MNKSIMLIKKLHIEEPKTYELAAPIGRVNKLFSIKEKKLELKDDQLEFLKELQNECENSSSIERNGSGRYFFKAGDAIIELFILVDKDNTAKIEPFLLFNEEGIAKDLMRILKKEYMVFCLLKKWGLQ